jgi:hypothetical protein
MEPSRESSQEPAPEPNHEPSHNPTGEPTQVPFIRYGVENKKIPGDSTGWKMKECGNIAHWGDIERYNVRLFADPFSFIHVATDGY